MEYIALDSYFGSSDVWNVDSPFLVQKRMIILLNVKKNLLTIVS